MIAMLSIIGALAEVSPLWSILGGLFVFGALAFLGAKLIFWTVAIAAFLVLLGAPTWLWIVFGVFAVLFNLKPLRTALISGPILNFMDKMKFLPAISETERTAIEAGTVWMDGELFSGRPDWDKLQNQPLTELTAKEKGYIDKECDEVCRITDDWEVFQKRDLSEETWEYLKKERFFGMIIPEEYGGLGFSPSAMSAVVGKLASRSMPLSITVMVPNSLGPAELLVHYGTKEQKDHYLPRLADGREIPAFALTEPNAGSDAGAISSNGEVFKGDDGKLYLRMNWDKRYITLAAVSTLLGMAFKLRDPDNLLGKGEDLGITCALIPTDTPGVMLGRRHDPLGVPFYNCPTTGEDVVVPVDSIIGGAEGAGKGWRMLMESLAAGRGISLPASATAGAKMAARITGSYTAIRKQFGLPIGKFEGIHEPMARIGGFAYTLEAARRYTCAGLDTGAKPAVVTAIAKYTFTELSRKCINDAMDILGGAGISRGKRNLLAHAYLGTPIGITVEGANILTRTLMIFGQGAIRCHPYAYAEIKAAASKDASAFDSAFWGHVGHVVRNGARALILSLTRGRLAGTGLSGPSRVYAQKLSWASASFGFWADVAMATLGGDLKRKETVTGRFSDIFSWMYMGNAVLRRFEAEGRRQEDLPFLHWSMQYSLARIQEGFDGLYGNLDVPVLGMLLKGPVSMWSRLNRISGEPSDLLGTKIAAALQVPGAQRDSMTEDCYIPTEEDEHMARLERTLLKVMEADAVAKKIKDAIRAKQLPRKKPRFLLDEALKAGVLTQAEVDLVKEAEAMRDDAVAVDSFTLEEYLRTSERDEPSLAAVRDQSA